MPQSSKTNHSQELVTSEAVEGCKLSAESQGPNEHSEYKSGVLSPACTNPSEADGSSSKVKCKPRANMVWKMTTSAADTKVSGSQEKDVIDLCSSPSKDASANVKSKLCSDVHPKAEKPVKSKAEAKKKKPPIPSDSSAAKARPSSASAARNGRKQKTTQKETTEESPRLRQTKITDYFYVRRSTRRNHSDVEAERLKLLQTAVLDNCEDGLEVVELDGKGRGVVATREFHRGDFVVEYAGDLIDCTEAKKRESKYSDNPDIGCYMYYFSHRNKTYCVDATAESGRLGRLINHSKHGNCVTRLVEVNSAPRLILVASQTIELGRELLYDYGDRNKESLRAHPWLLS